MNVRKLYPTLFKTYAAILFTLLLIPPLYVSYLGFFPTPSPIILVPPELTTEHFATLFESSQYLEALQTTLIVSTGASIITTVLGLLAAKVYMKADESLRGILLPYFILPILIPGIIIGLAMSAFFDLINIGTGTGTMIISSVAWAFPFSVLIYLTVLSNFDTSFRRASYDLGASKLYTFWKVEYPLIYPAVLGSLLFSFLLSFNEFIRGSFVSGSEFSISTLIYSTVSGGSARPEFFAASALMLAITVVGIVIYVYIINYHNQST